MIKKASDDKIKSVIFITDDSKEDWWLIEDSSGKKTIGPRPELVEEMRTEALIDLFMMYKTSGFLIAASETLKVEIDKGSVTDANNIFESVNTGGNTTVDHIYPVSFRDKINNIKHGVFPQSAVDQYIEAERKARNGIFPQNAIDQYVEAEINARNSMLPASQLEHLLDEEQSINKANTIYAQLVEWEKNKLK